MVFFKNDCLFTLFAVRAELIWDTFNRQVQLAWNSLTSPHLSGQLIMFTNLANIIFYTGQKKKIPGDSRTLSALGIGPALFSFLGVNKEVMVTSSASGSELRWLDSTGP